MQQGSAGGFTGKAALETEGEKTMTPRHVYDPEGFWIAFVVDSEVFLREGDWLGRLVGEHEIRDKKGNLVGLLDERNCLFILKDKRKAPTLPASPQAPPG